jgi:hypothetical protein
VKWQVGRHVELSKQADLIILFPLVNILLEFDLEIRITRWIPVIIIDTIDHASAFMPFGPEQRLQSKAVRFHEFTQIVLRYGGHPPCAFDPAGQ